jgi:chitosanase
MIIKTNRDRAFVLAVTLTIILSGSVASMAYHRTHYRNKDASPSASPTPSALPSISASPASTPAAVVPDASTKEIALEIVSTAENSTLNWWEQYGYIEDLGDQRGYTAGLMGFCSGTGDMLEVINHYTQLKPGNALAGFIPELNRLESLYASHDYDLNDASADTSRLGNPFMQAWRQSAADPLFQESQRWERDRVYYNPAATLATQDGLGALGRFIYFDAAVNMGAADTSGFQKIRSSAMAKATLPSRGGNEAAYLSAFLQARLAVMGGGAYGPVDRVKVQQSWASGGNLTLTAPLSWTMYGDPFSLRTNPTVH